MSLFHDYYWRKKKGLWLLAFCPPKPSHFCYNLSIINAYKVAYMMVTTIFFGKQDDNNFKFHLKFYLFIFEYMYVLFSDNHEVFCWQKKKDNHEVFLMHAYTIKFP